MASEPEKAPEIHDGNTPETIPEGNVFAYNLNESERPGGMKVRWKVRVETGQRAAHWNRRQAEAIREYLTWARSYRQQQEQQRTQD